MRHRLEHDHETDWAVAGEKHGFFAPPAVSMASSDTSSISRAIDSSFRSIPELQKHLAGVFPDWQRIGIMRRDASDARADREGHFDPIIDGGLITHRAQCAIVIIMTQGFQGVCGAPRDAAAAGAEDIPVEIEQPEPGCMQEAGKSPVLRRAQVRAEKVPAS